MPRPTSKVVVDVLAVELLQPAIGRRVLERLVEGEHVRGRDRPLGREDDEKRLRQGAHDVCVSRIA